MVRGISEGDTAIKLYYILIWRVHPLDRGDCTLRKTKNLWENLCKILTTKNLYKILTQPLQKPLQKTFTRTQYFYKISNTK